MFTSVAQLRTSVALVRAVVDQLLVRAHHDQVLARVLAHVVAELNLVVMGLTQDPGPGSLDHAVP